MQNQNQKRHFCPPSLFPGNNRTNGVTVELRSPEGSKQQSFYIRGKLGVFAAFIRDQSLQVELEFLQMLCFRQQPGCQLFPFKLKCSRISYSLLDQYGRALQRDAHHLMGIPCHRTGSGKQLLQLQATLNPAANHAKLKEQIVRC